MGCAMPPRMHCILNKSRSLPTSRHPHTVFTSCCTLYHTTQLVKYHSHVLSHSGSDSGGGGGWAFMTSEEYSSRVGMHQQTSSL